MKTDIEIQENVIEQLKWEPAVNAAEIGVAVTDGIVTLSGKVDSFYKKVMAERAVRKVAGVKAVAENIDVGLSPSDAKTDAELAAAVLHALRWDNAVPDEKIKVKVENGVVTLDGTVYFQYQRAAAGNAVEKLKGVLSVHNYIGLDTPPMPQDIKKKIMAAFHRSATIDAKKVQVEIKGSKVVLTGVVRSLLESDDAREAALLAPGVDSVENRLVVEEDELVY